MKTAIIPDDSNPDDRQWCTVDDIYAALQEITDMEQQRQQLDSSNDNNDHADLLYQQFQAAADDQSCFEIIVQHLSQLQQQQQQQQSNQHDFLSIPAKQVGLPLAKQVQQRMPRTQRLLHRQVAKLQTCKF